MQSYENLKIFLSRHSNCFSVLVLLLFCYLFLFFGLGAYPLIDIDETRYAAIAKLMSLSKNYITPFLNDVPFLEKPPLYFWLNVLSYKIFHSTAEFATRFPTALLGTFAVFYTYFFGRKVLGQAYGLISAFILLTSAWFLIFTHVAILDLGFMAFTMAAIYSAFLELFCKDKNKKFCWWAAYFFMALAVLMKGLIGVIIPAMVVFFGFLAVKSVKSLFRVQNWLVGLIIFFAICAPWHYLVYLQQGNVWVDEYIIKHHFARFIDSSLGLGRKQPFLFYVPIILGGFMPWTVSLFAAITSAVKAMIKDFKATKSIKPIFSTDTNDRKVLVLAAIYFAVVFLFFSISSSKLPTYILTAFPALALLCGYWWWGFISYGKFTKGAVTSTIITAVIFILSALIGANAHLFTTLPVGIETFRIFLASWLIIMSLISLLCMLAKNRALLFVSYIILMLGIIIMAVTRVFPFITSFGQNELEKYADKANSVSNSTLVTFDFPSKYSVLHYHGKVIFINDEDFKMLEKTTEKKKPVYVIVKNENFKHYKDRFENFQTIQVGQKYTLLVK